MRPKCLPDNREASVRASERMCESERETRRSGECGGEERANVTEEKTRGSGECGGKERAKEKLEETGSVGGRRFLVRGRIKKLAARIEGTRSLFTRDGKRDLYTVDEERLRWKVFIGGAREIVVR